MSAIGQVLHYPFDRALTSTKAGAPIATDDANAGFDTGHILIDTAVSPPEAYVLKDSTATAAVWEKISTSNAAEVAYDNGTSGLTATQVQAAIDELVGNLGGGGPVAAADVTYDDTASGLGATNVQAAIVELDGNVDTVVSDLAAVVAGTTDITYSNGTSGLTATTVKGAIDEVDGNVDAVVSDLDAVIAGTTDITYDPTVSGLTATTVKGAIDEVDGNVDAVVSDLADVVAGTTDIAFVPTGSLASTTLEAAINEAADAANVFVDTSASALTSNRVEAAINELANDSGLLVYDPATSSLTATTVQAALDQAADASNVFVDTTASALTSNRVEAAITELANDSALMRYSNAASILAETVVKRALDELADAQRPWLFRDEKGTGVGGGTSVADTWVTRDLNTSIGNTGTDVTLDTATGVITLQPALYRFLSRAPACDSRSHQTRLFDVTNSAVLFYGTSEHARTNNNTNGKTTTHSIIECELDLRGAGATEVRIDHIVEVGEAGEGFGIADDFGPIQTPNVYTTVSIYKIARP